MGKSPVLPQIGALAAMICFLLIAVFLMNESGSPPSRQSQHIAQPKHSHGPSTPTPTVRRLER